MTLEIEHTEDINKPFHEVHKFYIYRQNFCEWEKYSIKGYVVGIYDNRR